MSFNGFISYSHAADGRLAPAVQRGLHRLAKPWHRRRALWIFRDQTGLSVTPALWSSIQSALDLSDYFVLLSSPEAANSPWVNREIEHWVANKPAARILPVVTDGEWRWDEELGDFAEDSTAVPAALRGVFAEEPLYLDLRWARDDPHLSLRHSRFRDAIAQLAAPMHGVSKDDLEGEDVRQHRRAARLRWAAVSALLFLSLAAIVTGGLAVRNAAQANASAAETQRQQQLVAEQRLSAARFADEARRQEGFAQAQEARAAEAGAEAERQEVVARQQRTLAGSASAEAERQLANAGRAAADARQQQRLAKRQSALATESAKQMRRQEQRTEEQEKIAAEQRDLAAKAAAEARLQEQKAKTAGEEAVRQKANADQQQNIAVGRRLLNEAGEVVKDDPQYAVRLGIAAQRINPDAETRRGVAGLVTSTRRAGTIAGALSPSYGPNGLLAAVTDDGAVALWNTASAGNPVRLGSIDMSDSNYSPYLDLSGDGRLLATSLEDTVSLWNVANPSRPVRVATLPTAPKLSYYQVTFSPDSKTLAVNGGNTSSAELWDVSDPAHPAMMSALESSNSSANKLAFSDDGRTLVAYASRVDVWDIRNLRKPVLLTTIGGGSDGTEGLTVYSFALSTGAHPLLALEELGGTRLYDLTDLAKPEPKGLLTAPTKVIRALDFSSDGRLLVGGGDEGTAFVWDVTENSPSFEPDPESPDLSMEPREVTRLPIDNGIGEVEFSPDDKTLAVADNAWTVSLWNLAGFALPQRRAEIVTDQGLTDFKYAADGRTVTTVDYLGDAVVLDVTDPAKPVRRGKFTVGNYPLLSADGRTAIAEDEDDFFSLQLMDLTDPGNPVKFAHISPKLDFQTAVALSPDGRTLLVDGIEDGPPGKRVIQVWDLTNRSRPIKTATFSDPAYVAGGVAFSPDGRTLATSQVASVSFWDLTNRAAPAKLSTLSGAGAALMAFSPDGHTLALVDSAQRAVRLVDVTDPRQPRRVSTLPNTSTRVTALAFSADGQILATGSGRTAILWDVTQRTKPVRLATIDLDPEASLKAITFDKKGTLTIGARYPNDSRLSVWDLTAMNKMRKDPSKLGCTMAGRGLDKKEWALVVPELPYRSTCPG